MGVKPIFTKGFINMMAALMAISVSESWDHLLQNTRQNKFLHLIPICSGN